MDIPFGDCILIHYNGMKSHLIIFTLFGLLCSPLLAKEEKPAPSDPELQKIEQKMSNAKTTSELTSSSAEYAKYWDKKMNLLYNELIKGLDKNETLIQAVKKAQNAWLKLRDADIEIYCADPAFVGSATSLDILMHQVTLTKERCAALKKLKDRYTAE